MRSFFRLPADLGFAPLQLMNQDQVRYVYGFKLFTELVEFHCTYLP